MKGDILIKRFLNFDTIKNLVDFLLNIHLKKVQRELKSTFEVIKKKQKIICVCNLKVIYKYCIFAIRTTCGSRSYVYLYLYKDISNFILL